MWRMSSLGYIIILFNIHGLLHLDPQHYKLTMTGTIHSSSSPEQVVIKISPK